MFANLLRYKRKVRDVLLYLVKQSYEVRERTFYDPQGAGACLFWWRTLTRSWKNSLGTF